MYGYGGSPVFLGNLRHFNGIYVIIVETLSNLHRYGLTHCGRYRAYDFSRKGRVLHKGGAFAVVYYLRHGAAHVDVEYGKGAVFNLPRHSSHYVRVGPEELE